jgi:hypothetical protein
MHNSPLPPGSEQEWQELLDQLRRQLPAQPRPFFYARVQARLPARRATPLGWLRRPAYAALLGTLILAMSGDGAAAPAAQPPSPRLSSPAR